MKSSEEPGRSNSQRNRGQGNPSPRRSRAPEAPPTVPSPRSPCRWECRCRQGSWNPRSSRHRFLFLQFRVGQPVLPQPLMPLPGLICTANEGSGRKVGESAGVKRRLMERGQWDSHLAPSTHALLQGLHKRTPCCRAEVTSHSCYDPRMTDEGKRMLRNSKGHLVMSEDIFGWS